VAERGLRKGVTSYGDPAFPLFLRKAYVKAAGYSGDALDRPIVGIAAALLRVAQFAAAAQSHHLDPGQLGLDGWKMLGG
jgi:hypothetical protein